MAVGLCGVIVTTTTPPTQPAASSSNGSDSAAPLLDVQDLVTHFPIRSGLLRQVSGWVQAVDGVSLRVSPNETVGIVGESGCGKTTLGRSILRLVEPTSGRIRLKGEDVLAASGSRLRELRQDMQMVFQDPFSSLNPRMPVNDIVSEPLQIHGASKSDARNAAGRYLKAVGLLPEHGNRYPHEFSGGQRQRIGIARALTLEPDLVVLDEPVSALDVSIQAQVINLLEDLQEEFNLTYLFIAHDLSVVRHISDRIAVMYLGRVAELTDRDRLYETPAHPYTHALLSAIPVPDPEIELSRDRIVLQGDLPSPSSPPSGCRFRTRCPIAQPICAEEAPQLVSIAPGHEVACHFPIEPGQKLTDLVSR